MKQTLACALAFLLATPTVADVMRCTGSHPNWNASIDGTTASFTLRERSSDYSVELTTPSKNDPGTTAYTLIGATDTAILIVFPGRCNTADHVAHVLTQERTEAILLTGCCTLPAE